jgi:hypothetical protein
MQGECVLLLLLLLLWSLVVADQVQAGACSKGVATPPSYMTSPPGRTCKRL